MVGDVLEQTQQKASSHRDEYADVEGMGVHYVRAGSGPPLVLIHGLIGSAVNWRCNIDAFASHATVYAVDLVNMGGSARFPDLDVSLAATADRIVAWMDAVGLDQADIAGHSHGGAVVLMLAARHPERVRSLVLFAPANPYSHAADRMVRFYTSAIGRQFAFFVPFLPRPLQMFALARMFGDPARIPPACLDGYIEGLRVPGTVPHVLRIISSWFTEMRHLKSVLGRLAGIPVLLVWGDRDRAVTLDSARRLQRELPRSELLVLPGAGHVPFEELPAECNRLVLRWLDRFDLPRYESRSLAPGQPARAVRRSPMLSLPKRAPSAARVGEV